MLERLPRKRKKQRQTNSSDARQEKYVHTVPVQSPTNPCSHTSHRQEAQQIKEDLKNKQILKDLEAKRRGSSRPLTSRLPLVKRYLITPRSQKKKMTRRLSPRSRQRSKPTSENARKRQRRKKPSATALPPLLPAAPLALPLPSRPPLPLPLRQRRLHCPDVNSRTRDCRSGSRAAASRSPRHYRAIPVASLFPPRVPLGLAFPLTISHRLSVCLCSALREVAEFVAGQALTVDVDTVIFTQQFPRCVFSTLAHYDFLIPIPKPPKETILLVRLFQDSPRPWADTVCCKSCFTLIGGACGLHGIVGLDSIVENVLNFVHFIVLYSNVAIWCTVRYHASLPRHVYLRESKCGARKWWVV